MTRLRVLVAVARHGSVTAAARALNYAQPSVSHHLARLEAETGARLTQRSGRGIRLTDAGRLLAGRAEEILGRLDSAERELAAYVERREERVRLAGFPASLATIVPAALARLAAAHPGVDIWLAEAEPPEAMRMLRAGQADVALVFQDAHEGHPVDLSPEEEGTRARLILDEPVYLVTRSAGGGRPGGGRPGGGRPDGGRPDGGQSSAGQSNAGQSSAGQSSAGQSSAGLTDLAAHAHDPWIAGCEHSRGHLLWLCEQAGFSPRIAVSTDDHVAAQALVAAGLGVTILPSLALHAARHPGISAQPLAGARRHVLVLTYGEPPDPPAVERLIEALALAAAGTGAPARGVR